MAASVDDYLKDPETTEAEKALIAACREGRPCLLNDGKLPEEGATGPRVRAALIRVLALEATSLHEMGIWLEGAVITGELDLSFARCRGMLFLINCRFAEEPQMAQAELAQLSLEGSHLPGLFAQGAKVTGSLFLRRATATGAVDANGAQIGGQLDCTGATLDGGEGMALNAQHAKVTGGLFLRGVTATGTVDVSGAQIGGQLSCKGASLDGGGGKALNAQRANVTGSMILDGVTATGPVDVIGAQIGGQFDCEGASLDGGGAWALNGQSLRVEGGFLFRKVEAVTGRVYLSSAEVRDLVDDAESWRICSDLTLDGFTYDRIAGDTSPKTFAARKAWLEKGSRFEDEFRPQPYTQFARVMRAAGHVAEARKTQIGARIAAALHLRNEHRNRRRFFRALRLVSAKPNEKRWARVKEASAAAKGAQIQDFSDLLRKFRMAHLDWPKLENAPPPPDATTRQLMQRDFRNQMLYLAGKARLTIGFNWLKDTLSRLVIGYGYEPHRAIFTMMALVLPSAWFFSCAYVQGAMVPNSDVILTSPSWLWSVFARGDAPTLVWNEGAVARHYETFYALAYALDVFVPIVDLGQQSAWTATTVSWIGWFARIGTMVLEVLGWIVTALAAAAVTGLVQRSGPE